MKIIKNKYLSIDRYIINIDYIIAIEGFQTRSTILVHGKTYDVNYRKNDIINLIQKNYKRKRW